MYSENCISSSNNNSNNQNRLLKQSHKLFGCFRNVKCTLDNLLGHKVLVQRLLLRAEDEHPALGLKVCGRRRQRGQAGSDAGVTRLLREEEHHVRDCANNPF